MSVSDMLTAALSVYCTDFPSAARQTLRYPEDMRPPMLLALLALSGASAAPVQFSGLPWFSTPSLVASRLKAAGYVLQEQGRSGMNLTLGQTFSGPTLGRASKLQAVYDTSDKLISVGVCFSTDESIKNAIALKNSLVTYYTSRYGNPGHLTEEMVRAVFVDGVPNRDDFGKMWPQGITSNYDGPSLTVELTAMTTGKLQSGCEVLVAYDSGY